MVSFKALVDAYYTTRQNKRRSSDSVHFELHWQRNLLDLQEAINTRTLKPTAYTFVTPNPCPREIFACDMSMRIIHHYIDMRLRPYLEDELTTRTFNNRIGYGQCAAVNTLISDIYEVSEGFTKDAWIIKTDIKGYFPNASQQLVCDQLTDITIRRYVGEDKEDLLYMIQRAIFSYPTLHCTKRSVLWKWADIPDDKCLFKKPFGIGGAIGHLIWQNAMNYYLNDLDHEIVDFCKIHYLRFVDDIAIVTDNKEACLAYVVPLIRKRLQERGCTIHPKKFYCQHVSKGVLFIGSFIKLNRVYPNNRVVWRTFRSIRYFNRRVSVNHLESFIQTMNSRLGLLKTRNSYGILRNCIDQINPKWWNFCVYDDHRKLISPKENYKQNKLLCIKHNLFNIKYNNGNGKKLRRKASRNRQLFFS
jgi:hypothetical protein